MNTISSRFVTNDNKTFLFVFVFSLFRRLVMLCLLAETKYYFLAMFADVGVGQENTVIMFGR